MTQYVVGLEQVDASEVGLVGGKGANLGELLHLDDVRVPGGFCVTTEAYRHVVSPLIEGLLAELAGAADADTDRELGAALRSAIEALMLPGELVAAIRDAVAQRPAGLWAVRSSATAEDLPTASFAGQQDTYLEIPASDVVAHVARCWASLFTDRAVAYRRQQHLDHRTVSMAVVVQEMVDARASGVMFTSDPVTSNRTVARVEAVAGLGESLVSGQLDPESYEVRGDQVSVTAAPGARVLSDADVVRLVQLGRRLEAHFGRPQDVEWCLDEDGVQIVQSRPITTLFPVPASGDGGHRVYLSTGHQQMMTDAMKPLGLSFWRMTTPAPVTVAGGRLYVDATPRLASPAGAAFVEMMRRSDPLTADAIDTLLDRGFLPRPEATAAAPAAEPAEPEPADPDLVTGLIRQSEDSVARAARQIEGLRGEALLAFIETDMAELRRLLFDPRGHAAFMAAMEATWWLNEHLETWLGERSAADVLTYSVDHNITSEMGLALLDVADVVRSHPEVVAYLEDVRDDGFLIGLGAVPGGSAARAAIEGWLALYGMRCVGEIDITRPRWAEHPSALVPLILANVRGFGPGAASRRFDEGRRQALAWADELLSRLRGLPDGEQKVRRTALRIDLVRTYIGYREYPKYAMIARYFVYKRALLAEAARLVDAGVLDDPEDIFFLSFGELRDVVRTQSADRQLIGSRRVDFRRYETLTPPRVITSDGEVFAGSYRRDDVPEGSLVGLAVSAGTVEGRARVVLDMSDADLEPGDILVTTSTDPSWTPLFVAVAGLVTEVGGTMTHGAVIAREYGLPAVVGVPDATKLISDGRRIRVHGSEGFVELLDD